MREYLKIFEKTLELKRNINVKKYVEIYGGLNFECESSESSQSQKERKKDKLKEREKI